MLISMSDWHLGGGGNADDSNTKGIIKCITSGLTYKPKKIVLVGDITERWQFSIDSIWRSKRDFFGEIEDLLAGKDVEIHLINGNHDSDLEETVKLFKESIKGVAIEGHQESYITDGWTFLHGHQWDSMNRAGALQPIAHGLTWVAGVLERIFPGINESKLDPTSWFSPSHDLNQSMRGEISRKIHDFAEEAGIHLCYGHTHEADITRDRCVTNTGCCVGNYASYLALDSDFVSILQEFTE